MHNRGMQTVGGGLLMVLIVVGRVGLRMHFHSQAEQARADAVAEEEPTDDVTYFGPGMDLELMLDRAQIALNSGFHERAMPDLNGVIQAEPDYLDAYDLRSYAYSLAGEHAKAIQDLNVVLEKRPDDADLLTDRGWEWEQLGEWCRAVTDYEAAIRLDPESHHARNNLAWVLAAAPDDAVRDGERAYDLAVQAVEMSKAKNWEYAGTLAAAAAEIGRFDVAVRVQQMCREMAPEEEHDEIKAQLASYRDQKPWRMEAPSVETDVDSATAAEAAAEPATEPEAAAA